MINASPQAHFLPFFFVGETNILYAITLIFKSIVSINLESCFYTTFSNCVIFHSFKLAFSNCVGVFFTKGTFNIYIIKALSYCLFYFNSPFSLLTLHVSL